MRTKIENTKDDTFLLTTLDDVPIAHVARHADTVHDEDDVVDLGWLTDRDRLANLLRASSHHFGSRVATERAVLIGRRRVVQDGGGTVDDDCVTTRQLVLLVPI